MNGLRIRVPKRSRTEDTETDLRNKALKYFTDIFCKNGRIPVLNIGKTGHNYVTLYLYGKYAVKVFENDKPFNREIKYINKLRDMNCIVNFEILGKNTIVMEQWDGDVMSLYEKG